MRIDLSPEDAALFVAFRQHQDAFALLLEHGLFNIRNGSAEVHFDAGGVIRSMDIHSKVYRRVDKTIVLAKAVLQ